MLDANPPEKRVQVIRHVAGRVDISRAGPAQLVHEDSAPRRAGRSSAWRIGDYPDAGDGEVAPDMLSAGGHDRLQPPGPLERGHLLSGQ